MNFVKILRKVSTIIWKVVVLKEWNLANRIAVG